MSSKLLHASFVVHNQLKTFKVQTADDVHLRVFSIFYTHPAMIIEDGWKLYKVSEKQQILVDVDTLHIFDLNEVEFGFRPNTDMIETCKLTAPFQNQKDIDEHWEQLKKYASELKSDQNAFFDKKKVAELSEKSDDVPDIEDLTEKTSNLGVTEQKC